MKATAGVFVVALLFLAQQEAQSHIQTLSPQLPASAIRVPLCRQATDYTCGAAALQSVLAYYGEDLNESELSSPLKSNSRIGTRYKEMARFARGKGYRVRIHKNATMDKLRQLLDQGLPAIVLIQAWAGKKIDYSRDWQDGHYVVAIGHDPENIYFMDPSTLGNYTFIPIKEFLSRWHDKDSQEKLVHFAMTISKAKGNYQPASIKYMP